MNPLLIVGPLFSALMLLLAGYLFGARTGRDARDRLRQDLDAAGAKEQEARELTRRLAESEALLKATEQAKNAAEKKVEESQGRLDEKSRLLSEAEKQLATATSRTTTLEAELQIRGRKIEELEVKVTAKDTVARNLEKELADAKARVQVKEVDAKSRADVEKDLEKKLSEREIAVRELTGQVVALRERLDVANKDLLARKSELDGRTKALEGQSDETRKLAMEIERRKAEAQSALARVAALESQLEREKIASKAQMKSEIKELATALTAQREKDAEALEATVQRALRPVAARERMVTELAKLDVGMRTQTRLGDLLENIAKTGGFGTVILSDEVGLPLAVTQGAKNPDLMAASSSVLLSLFDRFVAHGEPSLNAAVLRDDSNQSFVHRLFRIGSERFVICASTHGLLLSPDVLDPAITKLERVLGDFETAA